MYIIGITGSIASGKSTVARILADMADLKVVEADTIIKELFENPNEEIVVKLKKLFGKDIFVDPINLDYNKLEKAILSDVDTRIKFNNFIFPIFRQRLIEYFQAYAISGHSYLVYDAPLLFESKTDDLVNCKILVHVPYDVQVQRLMKMRNLTKERASHLVFSQPPSEHLMSNSTNYLIRNTIDFMKLNKMVESIWFNILK